ncbi:beta-L-arabinofuranosidase domain-containing protein [Eisenbergiella tayi]|uniref:Non-reducing end beta-L-arabinofuranosidase n=1 Tax=Eisenbergiella tayi TaxID=1432052 RepID=A0A1E3AUD7_9FIRM|nr:beta-L-arabinofuranosidase domain-containing protein [Eisenbergiella tayi]ODM12328.1 hypothetical protein BEH84_00035 [Eisenbergiella tayi]
MQARKFVPLTTKEFRPQGWLKRQLEIQAEGLSGHLDLIWPDIRDSKWIGGDKEGWERVPYWLDGFIPLAYLLEDEDLIKRAGKYIDAILDRQEEDGWICPCGRDERNTYDVWAVFLICKVLVLYHDCTGDERIEPAVYRAMKNLLDHITHNTLFNWGAARWYECLIPLLWLYERRPEEWMLQLMYVLDAEGLDYEKLYEHFDFQHPAADKYWTQLNHVVNTAMALKSRALMSLVTGEDGNAFARKMYQKIMKYNSMATGHFTGDECLSGDSPVQGSECCSVAEAMYSCEVLLSAAGDPFWGDLLEKEAFNCLPATTTPDMWAHQYVQMTNQISCSRIPEEGVPFNSNGGEAHMFGLEPNFGCCTANFNQAWPKFALSALMRSGEGLAVMSMVPVEAKVRRDGAEVDLQIVSEYPFRDEAVIEVTTDRPVTMELLIRIPGFAKEAFVDGEKAEPESFYRIYRTWEGSTRIPVRFVFDTLLTDRPFGAKAVVRGPLVFSLPVEAQCRILEYTRDGVERKAPYCDYEFTPVSDWNYGFCSESFEISHGMIGDYPFSVEEPPVCLKTKMVKVPWEEKYGVCAVEPSERKAMGEPEEKVLQPYGCTNLRMTEMPYIAVEL